MTSGDLQIVKAGLQERVRDVCAQMLPDGRERGGQWESVNPVTGDFRKTPALKVGLNGNAPGAWRDYRSGDKGDILGLVAYVLTGDARNAKEALAWGRDFLGLGRLTRDERAALKRSHSQRQAAQDKKNEQRRRWKLANVQELFAKNTCAQGYGTPAQGHARRYFAARNVPLEAIPNLNFETFRYSPSTEWWRGAEWKHEGGKRFKVKEGPRFPAIHSAMRVWNGALTACHITFLDPVRPAKAPVEAAKLMWGEALGAVIEISCGWSQAPFWQADESQAGPLILAEGIETAMAFAVAEPAARVWACGSLSGVGSAPINLPCVDWVLFARDNNDGNAQAQQQFDKALQSLEQHGKRIVVEASHVGDDFNDLATGEED